MVAFFVPPQFVTKTVTELAFLTSATAAGQTVTCPTVQQYDIGILSDVASNVGGGGLPANVIPSGFTQIQTSSLDVMRTTLSYKMFAGTESGATLTGMLGGLDTAKILTVFRPAGLVTSVSLSTFLQETTNGDPSSQAISASGQSPPLIRFACGGAATPSLPPAPPFTSGTFDATITRFGASNYVAMRVGYAIQNSSPSNDTVDTGDNGINSLVSGWLRVA